MLPGLAAGGNGEVELILGTPPIFRVLPKSVNVAQEVFHGEAGTSGRIP